MSKAELIRSPSIVDPSLRKDERGQVIEFVNRRVRRLILNNPSLEDPSRKGDITASATTALKAQIPGEIAKIRTAHATVWSRVRTDGEHLSLSMETIRKRVSTRPPAGDPRTMRRRLVMSIVYQAAAEDITLADPANVDRLHKICDRRLRIAERMLYDVGRADHRAWSRSQIAANKGGPWVDGLERLFEYPRVPQSYFLGPCDPNAKTGACAPPMADWRAEGSQHLTGPIRTNPTTRPAWRPAVDNGYDLLFTASAGQSATAAIEGLFTPTTDYLKRNLLFCDHTVHALHLEAMVFAERKRGKPANWLDDETRGKPAQWLRLYVPFSSEDFLVAEGETAHFEHTRVSEHDLQVGDHLIVYNHPAYEHATIAGVWRLENALVVQTYPELRMQGHGSRVYTKGGMWRTMVGLFNRELDQRRADVEGLARVVDSGTNWLKVDSLDRLREGMAIEIADPRTDVAVATNRLITRIVRGKAYLEYDGASVTVPSGQVIRRPRRAIGSFEGVSVGDLFILRRVPRASSTYADAQTRADWHLIWSASSEEEAIRQDPARAAFVKTHQLVDYTRETFNGNTLTIGWFPLWRPTLKGKSPVRGTDGKITATEKVVVKPDNIAGWTWFFDPDPAKQGLVPVIRPKEA